MDGGDTETFMSWRTFALAAAAIAVVAGSVGYWIGASRHDAFETVGAAHSTEAQIGLQTDDWTYNVPLTVQWTDDNGVWHGGGRPECLPPSDTPLEGIRVTAVPVEARGVRWRQVLVVHCD